MWTTASDITNVRICFTTSNRIAVFFSYSPDRWAAFEYGMYATKKKKRIPHPLLLKLNFQSKAIQIIFSYKDDILEYFKIYSQAVLKEYNWDTIILAAGFVNWLENRIFVFWLTFY